MLATASKLTRLGALDRTNIKKARMTQIATRSSMLDANEGRKLIVGLGNPGKQYHGTRHNVGFTIIDQLAEAHGITMTKTKFNSIYGTGFIGNQAVVLVKPQTYMNLSGSTVKPWLDFHRVELRNCMIVHDAADIPVGDIKLKIGGSSGGQNGVKHIIERLGTKEFPRLKLGIGRPDRADKDMVSWVLTRFPSIDAQKVDSMFSKAQSCLLTWVESGAEKAMCDFNGEATKTPKKEKKPRPDATASSSAPSSPPSSETSDIRSASHEG